MTSPRLGRVLCVLSLVPVLALAGCLKDEEQVRLQKDGSGTLVVTSSIDKAGLDQLKGIVQYYGGAGGLAGGPAAKEGGAEGGAGIELKVEAFLTADDLKARMKGIDGVELKKSEASEKDGKKNFRAEVAFASLESLAKCGVFSIFAVDLAKNADGTYTLKFESIFGVPAKAPGTPAPQPGMEGSKPEGPAPEGGFGGMDMSTLFAMLQTIIADFEMKRTIVVPGQVTDTNGMKKDLEGGTSVTWTVGFKELSAGKRITQSVTFKGDGLELKPFSYKPTFADLQKRYLKLGGEPEGGEGKEGKEKPPAPTTPDTGGMEAK